MRILPIQWINADYGIRLVDLPDNVIVGNHWKEPRKKSLRCRYWQIWQNGVERKVVDTALTARKARERVRYIMNHGGPLL